MPIISSLANIAAKAYGMMSSPKKIFDYFTRTTTGSLGTATSGDAWESIRGTWTANGSQGTTATAASSYPIAAVNFTSPNATINLDVSDGSGAAFWISDSQNWWGLGSTSSISGNVCSSGYVNYSAPYTIAGQFTAGTPSYTAPDYTDPGYVSQYCVSYAIGYAGSTLFFKYCSQFANQFAPGYTFTAGAFTAGTPSYTAPSYYSPASYSFYCGAYANTYNYSLTLVKSVSNTITTVATQALSAAAASIRLILNGTSITGTGYSSTGQGGSNLGTITNTATGATRTSKHGIILIPSSQQQTTVDNFSIDVI